MLAWQSGPTHEDPAGVTGVRPCLPVKTPYFPFIFNDLDVLSLSLESWKTNGQTGQTRAKVDAGRTLGNVA